MNNSAQQYRIIEETDGKYRVETLSKIEDKSMWLRCNMYGIPIVIKSDVFIVADSTKHYDTIGEARQAIKRFKHGEVIHNEKV